jgi:hypothetical protein
MVWRNYSPEMDEFYTKVLTKYVQAGGLTLRLTFKANPSEGITDQQIEETKTALHELGLDIDNTASTIAWAIDCFQNKLISKKDTDGLELN